MSFSIEKYHFATGSILDGLPQEDFRLLRNNMKRMEVKKGKPIFSERDYSRGIYLLRKGKVKIFQTNKDGKEQIVYIYRKGEIMGYRSLLYDGKSPVSATALDDCVISLIPKKYFLQVLNRSLTLSNRLLRHLSHEFSVLVNTISVFAQQPVRARIALSLLILNEKYKRERSTKKHVVINLSRDDLANYVGTAKETLVRMLQEFKLQKIISSKGRKIKILRPKELERIADLY